MSLKLLISRNLDYSQLLADPNLQVINVDFAPLNSYVLDDILARLKLNNSVIRLSMAGCQIGPAIIHDIAEILAAEDNQIEFLNLSENDFGPHGVQYITDALNKNINSKLYELKLRNVGAGLPGAINIAEMLKINTTLTTLNLGSNQIQDEGVNLLITALQSNSNNNLTKLVLNNNDITDQGAIKLAEYLSTNPRLIKLKLKLNNIKTPGLTALLESLQINTTLEELDLAENIQDEDIDVNVYLNLIKFNTQITMINLHHTGIHLADIKEIKKIAKRNKHNKDINSKTLIDILGEYKKYKIIPRRNRNIKTK